MPDQPTVACILLTKDRPQTARRAVASFRAQTYANKKLLILENREPPGDLLNEEHDDAVTWIGWPYSDSIGKMRNAANSLASPNGIGAIDADIFAHWDDDDLSHANRIAEQVALLEASGADVVGYREMLFWRQGTEFTMRTGAHHAVMQESREIAESWLYSNPDPRYCIGSSLMYWRAAWARNPFNENLVPTGRGEDHEFWRVLKSVGVSSIHSCDSANFPWRTQLEKHGEPRMICSIHAGNAQHYPSDVLETSTSWKRAPAWDNWCRKAMAL